MADSFVGMTPFLGNVAIVAIFYRKTYQIIDVDNLLKAVLDAGTRAKLWEDDSQVTALVGIVEHDRERPRAVIAFGSHTSTLGRGINALATCEACGKRFSAGGQRRDVTRWCSIACRTVLAKPVICPTCGSSFRRRNGNHRYCSNKCRPQSQRKSARVEIVVMEA